MNRCEHCKTFVEFSRDIWRFICPNCLWIGYGEDTISEINIDKLVNNAWDLKYIKFSDLLEYKLRDCE